MKCDYRYIQINTYKTSYSKYCNQVLHSQIGNTTKKVFVLFCNDDVVNIYENHFKYEKKQQENNKL